MNNKTKPLYKLIWCKIRYYQRLNDLSNEELAAYLGVCERTLSEYDKHAENITLGKIDSFLRSENLNLGDLLAL